MRDIRLENRVSSFGPLNIAGFLADFPSERSGGSPFSFHRVAVEPVAGGVPGVPIYPRQEGLKPPTNPNHQLEATRRNLIC